MRQHNTTDLPIDERTFEPRPQPPQGRPPNRFTAIALDDIEVDDDPVSLIEGLLPAGPAFHLVWGPPKSLKSFCLVDTYLHIAAGREYAGRKVLQGTVVYVTNEGIRGVKRRIVAMRRYLKIGRGVPFYLVPAMPNLGTGTDDAAKLIATIEAVAPPGVTVRAIAIDTLRRATPGKDENSAKDMSPFIENCGAIANRFRCVVSGVHHSPRSDTKHGAGTNALDGATDCGWSVARYGDSNRASITLAIMKDGEHGESWDFRLHPVQVGAAKTGEPIISCAIAIERPPGSQPATTPATASKDRMPKAAQIALRALHEALDELGAVSPASNHIPPKMKTVTIDQWRRYAYARGISDGEERAQQAAFKRGYEYVVGSKRAQVWDGQVWALQ